MRDMAQDKVSREVAELIQQRQQYRAFLTRLEERAAGANPRAFERVRADYQQKLRALGAKLVQHAGALRAALEGAEAAATDLEVRRDAKAEELEEARLRHSVGEYADEKEWKAAERKLTKELGELEAAIEQQRASVANLTEVLEQVAADSKAVRRPAAASGPAPAAEPPEKPVRRVRAPGQITEDTPRQVEAAAKPSEEPARADTDLLDLAAAPEAASDKAGVDELQFLESLALTPEEKERKKEEDERGAAPLGFLSGRARGKTETIICPRCSAANDPAEWYCAECGEELPAG